MDFSRNKPDQSQDLDQNQDQSERGWGPEAAADWRRTRDCEGLGLKLETGSDRTQVGLFAETLKSVGVLSSWS